MNNLKTWREGAGMSREQLAERLETTATSIYRIETGRQQPRPGLLTRIARLFGVTPGDFYSASVTDVAVADPGTRRLPIMPLSTNLGVATTRVPPRLLEPSIQTSSTYSELAVGLPITGHAMEPDFVAGDVVIIDPHVQPTPGDCVLAVDEKGELVFRRYHDLGINDAGEQVFELVCSNPAFAPWRSDKKQISVRGTMVEHRRFRRNTQSV